MSSHDFDRHLNLTRVGVRGLTISLWGFYTSLQKQLGFYLSYLSRCNSKFVHYISFQMMILEGHQVALAYTNMISVIKVIIHIVISFTSPLFIFHHLSIYFQLFSIFFLILLSSLQSLDLLFSMHPLVGQTK